EMEKLCLILRCTPNDFMEWEPESSKNHDPEHPLNRIIKSNKAQDLIKTIYSAPPGYLPSLEKKIREELEKLEG
ncbi:MAG: hypothetical protein JEZ03_16325, partial [Bacteroidales bacterium]|nr:hypothetical protein [Bacteroidales bacterium]